MPILRVELAFMNVSTVFSLLIDGFILSISILAPCFVFFRSLLKILFSSVNINPEKDFPED